MKFRTINMPRLFLGGALSAYALVALISGLVGPDRRALPVALIMGAIGLPTFILTIRAARTLILSPEGISINHRKSRIDIPWDALADVHTDDNGKFASVTLRWWNAERTRTTDTFLSMGSSLGLAVGSAIKRCWLHPERRSNLRRVSP